MSISRERVLKAYDTYKDKYDLTNPKIKLKVYHTGRVASMCERIAKELGLSQEDVDLAWTTGKLHDIGRFEQLRIYGTFKDAVSVVHAKLGADILFVDGLIEQFGAEHMTDDELDIIETSIRQHSLYKIDYELSERQKLFCNILRDADKIDIMRMNVEEPMEVLFEASEEEILSSSITPGVLDNLREEHSLLRELRKTPVDMWLGHISMAFDLVYPVSRQIAKEQGNIQKMLQFKSKNPETDRDFQEIAERVRKFLEIE